MLILEEIRLQQYTMFVFSKLHQTHKIHIQASKH